MKRYTQKDFLFIGRSMLWSVLLYAVIMAVLNWEDVSGTILGKNAVTIVSHTLPAPATVTDPPGAPASISASSPAAGVATLLHTILQVLPR